jgi:hypothetical protein
MPLSPDDRPQATAPGEAETLPPVGGAAGPTLAGALPPELQHHPRYRVLKLLGQGGMGAVYLAEQVVMGRRVALKTINTRFLTSPDAVARFHREVQAAAKLTHPNVVAAYDAEQAGGLHFLIMEYVDGISVAEYARRKGPLPVPQACTICGQAALGLQHAHEQGLVHRDIKPHNLMLTARGQVKVLDFGLAHVSRQESTEEASSLTATGTILGTADYIAPEQTSSTHTVDIRADVYSLGCTLYYLLTGRVPFPGGTVIEKCVRHAMDAPPPVSSLRPGLPAGLVAVVEKMMAKRPRDRYQTPADVNRALRPFAEAGHAPAARPPVALPAGVEPPPAARPRAAEAPSESLTEALRTVQPVRDAPRDRSWRRKVAVVAVAVTLLIGAPAVVLLALALRPAAEETGKDGRAAVGAPATPHGSAPSARGAPSAAKVALWEGEPPKPVIADPAHALNAVLDFREVEGVTSKELHEWRDSLGTEFRLSFVNSRKGTGPALFNAVAVREKSPLLARFFPEMNEAEADRTYKRTAPEPGSRFLSQCSSVESGRLLNSQLWLQDGSKWYMWWGTLTRLTDRVTAEKKQGLRPIFFEAAWAGDRGLFWAVGAPDQGLQSEPYYTLGPEEIVSTAEFGKRKRLRPDALTAYWDGERFRFILALLENRDRLDWSLQTDMTLSAYKKESSEQKRRGLLPLAVTSYGDETDVRYTAVWVRYRLPE